MNNPRFCSLLLLLFAAGIIHAQIAVNTARKGNTVDTSFGVAVPDPYRWMETPNSEPVNEWLREQRGITRSEKSKFDGRFTVAYDKLVNHGGFITTYYEKMGPYYFRLVYTSGYSSPVLFYKTSLNADAEEVFNPNNAKFGQSVSIAGHSLSNDARYLAVSLSTGGSDWQQIRVRDLKKRKTLPDQIEFVKFGSVCWADSGFYYSRFSEPPAGMELIAVNKRQQLCFHKLGEPQEKDVVIYAIPEKANSLFHFDVTSNKQYLLLYTVIKIQGQWCNAVCYQRIVDGPYAERKMFIATLGKEEIEYEVVDLINGRFIVKTNLGAPHYQLLSYSMDSTNEFYPLVPEFTEVLKTATHIGGNLFCKYFSKGAYTTAVFDYKGEFITRIRFPEGESVDGFDGTPTDTVVMFAKNSFYYPRVAYTLNLKTFKTALVGETKVYYNALDYTSSIETFRSADGTEIPMYLTYKKGLKLKNNNPVLLYGYGGFGVSLTPSFDFTNIIFFENNGILAVPLIRGGGEMGTDWHKQGKGLNKQNSFNDFIAAAEYLIREGYTSKERLTIKGGSNGGLLVGAALTQRPDLFKVAIAEMGVFDMLRYHLFTGGGMYKDEYGDPDNPVQFENLLKYSPLHNVKDKTDYPATLLVTAENDDRVPPFHSYKFLATLQEKSANQKPHVLYFEEDAGHYGPGTYEYRMREAAFELAFMFRQMGLPINTHF